MLWLFFYSSWVYNIFMIWCFCFFFLKKKKRHGMILNLKLNLDDQRSNRYNCRDRVRCLLNGNCLINNIIYNATIKEEVVFFFNSNVICLLYLACGSKEKTNTGWKFLNNYINKKEKQGNKVKNQLYKFVAYNIKWKWCVCEARVHWWSCML